jgi:preprotein translocase subunit SecD
VRVGDKKGCSTPAIVAAGCGGMLLLVFALIAAGSAWYLLSAPSLARDGGLQLTLDIDYLDLPEAQREAAAQEAAATVRERVDGHGLRGAEVLRDGDALIVRLPGVQDIERVVEQLTTAYRLEFRGVDESLPTATLRGLEVAPPDREILWQGGYDPVSGEWQDQEPFLVETAASMTGDVVADARISLGMMNEPYVAIDFDEVGTGQFCALSTRLVGQKLAIVLDDRVVSAPVVQEPICGGGASITMGYDTDVERATEDAEGLAVALRAGALPVDLRVAATELILPQ